MNSIFNVEDHNTRPKYSPDIGSRNPWKAPTLIMTSVLFIILIGYAALSPFLSVWGMRNAAIAKDGKKFATYIDFPVFKENLKAEMNAFMMQHMAEDQSMRDNPFAGFGLALAPTIVNNMVDNLVTPAGVERMMDGSFIPKDAKITASTDKPANPFTSDNVTIGYESLNEFSVYIKNDDGKVTKLFFERHWIGDWKLSNIKLPR